jgi:DNA-binding response OmpR family regulator
VPARILVVDDSAVTTETVALYLRHAGHDVLTAANGRDALRLATGERPDLIVLDIMLPLIDGLEVCRNLRARSAVPIIMLTARTSEADRLRGLDAGADDYVTKPFSPRELVARVAAVLRRTGPRENALRAGPLEIDRLAHDVRWSGASVPTTPAEFRLLEVLVSSPGRAWTRSELADRAFGVGHDVLERTIDAHIMNLRRKLEPDRGEPQFIETVFGVGYRFRHPDAR